MWLYILRLLGTFFIHFFLILSYVIYAKKDEGFDLRLFVL